MSTLLICIRNCEEIGFRPFPSNNYYIVGSPRGVTPCGHGYCRQTSNIDLTNDSLSDIVIPMQGTERGPHLRKYHCVEMILIEDTV